MATDIESLICYSVILIFTYLPQGEPHIKCKQIRQGIAIFNQSCISTGEKKIWKTKILFGECHTYQKAAYVFQVATWYHGVLESSANIVWDIFGNTIASFPTISLHHHSEEDKAIWIQEQTKALAISTRQVVEDNVKNDDYVSNCPPEGICIHTFDLPHDKFNDLITNY